MAKRKIIWSHKANIKLFSILDYYTQRNKSTLYSRKLYKKFKAKLTLLLSQPEIGIITDFEKVRGLIVDNFILFYELTPEFIIVHSLWDCRQNPDDLIVM
jgi:hypothetical protein